MWVVKLQNYVFYLLICFSVNYETRRNFLFKTHLHKYQDTYTHNLISEDITRFQNSIKQIYQWKSLVLDLQRHKTFNIQIRCVSKFSINYSKNNATNLRTHKKKAFENDYNWLREPFIRLSNFPQILAKNTRTFGYIFRVMAK